MRDAWKIQKLLCSERSHIMDYVSLANLVAKEMGWPSIERGRVKYREFSKQYLIKYLDSLKDSRFVGYVVLVKNGGYCKIVLSSNLENLKSQYQSLNPEKLDFKVLGKYEDMTACSQSINDYLESLDLSYTVSGWFKYDKEIHFKC